ncbi:glycoside hydrolase family 3 protein, partial [bacterium]
MKKLFAVLVLLLVALNPAQAKVSINEKISQMIMVGFRGDTIDVNSAIYDDIKSGRIGGVVLFDYDVKLKSNDRNIKNPEQVLKLTKQIQASAKTQLFIAIDQEGGRVNRLKEAYGFPKTISAAKLGEIDDPKTTFAEGNKIAKTLKSVGININFAPVVDLNTNPNNPIIGKIDRAFSNDPEKVYQHSKSFIEGHTKENILCVIKHFPGHGSSSTDSHEGFVDVSNTWASNELLPYKQLIRNNHTQAIMTAHVFNKNLDYIYPATLSKKCIEITLRQYLKFPGIVISDDLQMKAISANFGLEETIVLAINAGVDILLFANNLEYDPNIAKKVH